MSRNVSSPRTAARVGMLAAAIAVIAACQRDELRTEDEQPTAVDWAQAALARNPQLEVLATDRQAEIFTVRDKQTGEIRTVKMQELVAAPITQLAQLPVLTESARVPSTESDPQSIASDPSGIELPAGTEERPAAEETPTAADWARSAAPSYTIERTGDQIRVSGPGVSIVSTGGARQMDEGLSRGRLAEPIICEGRRMMHLDRREIFVEGNAVTVRGGCELHLTNSRIVATGTALVVQDGTVHVSNSTLAGQQHSFDVGDEAKLFARSSTFTGIPRRSQRAVVQDQGGNRWR
ncbi:MAG: hypothetical protein C0P74_000495 [Gammaproteobacteria bacterium]